MKASYKIIISIVIIIVLYFVLFPGLPISVLKDIKESLKDDDTKLRTEIDSILNLRVIDRQKFNLELKKKDIELQNISIDLQIANKKVRRYELQIIDYRNSTYNERFVVFTKLITETDTIQR